MARPSRLLLSLLWLVLGACRGPADTSTIPPPSTNDTTLGSGDVFDIRVFNEVALSGTYRVGQDGTIDFPLVGRVNVVGLEPGAVARMLEDALQSRDLLRNPQVSVFVQEYLSKRVSVVGAVSAPGNFPIGTGLTLVQAISLAGGFSDLADRNGTTLSRRVNGEVQRFRVPVDDIVSGHAADLPVGAGDIINVPRRVF
ncbi:MAG: polysaccharide biosynthesis/export family protein [Sandaracinaceae bacterium]|nr:polysaccharide biosynthesis/export family protein [Sandaracinaceae bacterium]